MPERSAGFDILPRSCWLIDFAVWGPVHRGVQAMRCYNGIVLPRGLLMQRRLILGVRPDRHRNPVAKFLLVCRRDGRRQSRGAAEDVGKESKKASDIAKELRYRNRRPAMNRCGADRRGCKPRVMY